MSFLYPYSDTRYAFKQHSHTSFNKWKHTHTHMHTTPIRMNKWGTQSFEEQWIRISFNFNILIWWAISEIASQFAKLIVLCHASHFSVLVFIIKCTCAVQWLFLGSLTKSLCCLHFRSFAITKTIRSKRAWNSKKML